MNVRPKFGRSTPPSHTSSNPHSQITQPVNQDMQQNQMQIPQNCGSYPSIPMPPPANPHLISPQYQVQNSQHQPYIPEQNYTYQQNPYNHYQQPISRETAVFGQVQNQQGYNNGPDIYKSADIYHQSHKHYHYKEPLQVESVILPTSDVIQQSKEYQYSSVILKTCELSNTQNSQILENFKIISNSQIKDMDISSKTHNMITIQDKSNEFQIQPFDENLKKEKQKNKQLINSNLLIIQNKNTNIPNFECLERLCQMHQKPIEKICAEKECKELNELLLCQECAREHKGHNLFDIPEALFLILKSQQNLEKDDQLIQVIQQKAQEQFKHLKSNITWQLSQIEEQLHDGFNNFKNYLLEKKNSYQKAFEDLQLGGLSKMVEQANLLFDQGLFQEVNLNQNEQEYLKLSDELNKVKQSMKKFLQFVEDDNQEYTQIKLNNVDIQIESQKIDDLNQLYYQIKIDSLNQKFTNILDQELLLLQNNKAIRLKENYSKINLKQQQNIQIVSYQQI
ncbi:unnamed protein product (macronuclear) [Paramecium tetraurelia]|uniref:B box-type domain-containing protein n=1 Tax=Paramecium tetraurelia TaxID=5888 RepID=A0CHD5_PARTE|nr:uncharacterized protein GSPATT00038304001 [Paramecium tetraurelia]CAK70202.1 unnamed protein product [Paramecium tetraurelia]|eukprot:XP_001437599.1 hypothetical protein (macronuclear) [Paramecium tetraurelia strain d4-2]